MKLKDLGEYFIGLTYKPEDVSDKGTIVLRSGNIQDGQFDLSDIVRVDTVIREKQYVKPGDILMCSRNGSARLVGKSTIIPAINEPMTFGAFMTVFRTPYNDYLKYFLQSRCFRAQLAGSKTTTINQITIRMLDGIDIDLPDNSEREERIKKLEILQRTIRLRKQELRKFDELIKARFVEMFGDPVSNPKGWRVIPWEEVFDTKTGKLDSNAAVEGGEYPFFTCAKDWLWIDKYAYDCEALLLAGNNAAGVYDVKHYKGKFNAYQRTYILQLKGADWSYSLFKYQLEDRLQYLQSQSKGTNTRYLTMGILNSLSFIVPPNEMQDAFTCFVAQVDKSKVVIQQALDKAQLLFDSLMQEYFG